MTALVPEILQSWRGALRRPAFLSLAAATLALGIGACVAVFALVDAVLLQPPPYPEPDRLAVLSQDYGAGEWARLSPQQYQLLDGMTGVERLGAAFASKDVNIAGIGEPQLVSAWPVDAGLLPTLGVRLALGRNFTADEDRPNGAHAAIFGYAFWQRHFNADPAVVGKTVIVDGVATPVVGVLPESFHLVGAPDLLLPYALARGSRDNGTNLLVIARLASGTSVAAAASALDARLQSHAGELGIGADYRPHFTATSLADNMGALARPVLLLFFACALCVLLLVAVNLANLMLLRSIARSHDSAVRAALGASAFRLGLPALAEGLLVGVLGAGVGLALAVASLRVARTWIPGEWLSASASLLGTNAIAFALASGLAVAVLAALFGVWRGRGRDTITELRTRSKGDGKSARLGRVLVIAQAALATVLLASAALLAHSLWKLGQVDAGFDADNVLVFRLNPSVEQFPDTRSVDAFATRLLDRLRAEPGVRDAALTTNLPIGSQLNLPVRVSGTDATIGPQFRAVSADSFATFGIPLGSGRAFTPSDSVGGEPVAIVNAAFARQYLDDHALGQRLQLAVGENLPLMRVVGVVGDVHQFGPGEAPPPILYVPLGQVPDNVMALLRQFVPLNVALKVTGDAAAFSERARAALREVAPQQGMAALRLLERDVADATAAQRMNAILVGLFAAVALLLAGIGLYSVTAVAVATREREFGVRAALGAPPLRLLRGVLGAGLRDVGIGLAIGLLAALAAASLLERFLFGVGASDPLAIGATLVVLLGAGFAATLLPALRAARIAPIEALRNE